MKETGGGYSEDLSGLFSLVSSDEDTACPAVCSIDHVGGKLKAPCQSFGCRDSPEGRAKLGEQALVCNRIFALPLCILFSALKYSMV